MKDSLWARNFTLNNWISLGMLFTLYIYMFSLNYLMPLHRDDYEYALIWGTFEKIQGWPDVFQSLYNHYMTHGGRMVDFFVLDSFLLLGKQWFNPVNAFLYVALNVLIYWFSLQKVTFRFNPYILGLIILFTWLGLPHFALVNIWMTGACVYLMPAVFIFSFLLPYYFHFLGKPILKDHALSMGAMFLGGIVAAWTIENTAATMNFIAGAMVLYYYKKKALAGWMVSGLCGGVLGFALLVAAPGNYVRYASTNTKWIYHITNQIAAGGEMLLYIFPILLFFLLLWRILLTEQPSQEETMGNNSKVYLFSSLLTILFIAILLISYTSGGFLWKWLANIMYSHIAIPLGLASDKLRNQFFNTMSGLEEMLIYLLTVGQIFRYAFYKLRLRKQDMQEQQRTGAFTQLIKQYPACRYAMAFFALCIINNLAMLASPSFPGRAVYGSVVFFIIGVMSLFTIPKVYDYFFGTSRKQGLAFFTGLILIPMASAVLWQHMLLHQENTARMSYVEKQVQQGAVSLELEPLTLKNHVLRHVYFVELNNSVSKYGFCRYYGLQNVVVKEEPRW